MGLRGRSKVSHRSCLRGPPGHLRRGKDSAVSGLHASGPWRDADSSRGLEGGKFPFGWSNLSGLPVGDGVGSRF